MSTVLISGASKGIGLATCRLLARNGTKVLAGYRSQADADALREISEHVRPIQLDVTEPEHIRQAGVILEAVLGRDGVLDGLVNNAGIVVAGPLEAISREDFRRQFEVNVFGVHDLTNVCLPWLKNGPGRIVNVSSINGRVVSPRVSPYAASKFALEAISDGYRMELKPWNVQVSVVQPGPVVTPIWETSLNAAKERIEKFPESLKQQYAHMLEKTDDLGKPPAGAVSAEKVAKVISHALTADRPKTRYLVGAQARIAARMKSVLPDRWFDALLTRR